MINTDKFTRKSLKLIDGAVAAASELGHTYIGSEHMLLSISDDGSTRAADILIENGVSYDDLRAAIIDLVGQGSPTALNQRYFTTAARRIFESAYSIAASDRKKQASPEHILAAMIKESSCSACTIIKKLGDEVSLLIVQL